MGKTKVKSIKSIRDLRDGVVVDLIDKDLNIVPGIYAQKNPRDPLIIFVRNAGEYSEPRIELIYIPMSKISFIDGAVKIPPTLHPDFFDNVRKPDKNTSGNRPLYRVNEETSRYTI